MRAAGTVVHVSCSTVTATAPMRVRKILPIAPLAAGRAPSLPARQAEAARSDDVALDLGAAAVHGVRRRARVGVREVSAEGYARAVPPQLAVQAEHLGRRAGDALLRLGREHLPHRGLVIRDEARGLH